MSETQERPNNKRISWILWGILAILVALLVAAFSRSWTLHEGLKDKEALLAPMLTEQYETQVTLEAQLTYVQSDAYVEEWAREHAGMTQPEETLVVPILYTPTPTHTPAPTFTPTPTPTPLPFWQQWWKSLTGK